MKFLEDLMGKELSTNLMLYLVNQNQNGPISSIFATNKQSEE